MLAITSIAHEFPLLAAIAGELRRRDGGNEVAILRDARRVLKDAFGALDRQSNVVEAVEAKRRFNARTGRN